MSVTKYILVGSEYVPYIKRHKSDRVYWKDVLPNERMTEMDLKERVRDKYIEKYYQKWYMWYGCGRAEFLEWHDEWGNPDWKYKPCHMKPYDNTGFCKRHIKSAREDGYIPATYGSITVA